VRSKAGAVATPSTNTGCGARTLPLTRARARGSSLFAPTTGAGARDAASLYREPSQVARDIAALYREASQVARDTAPLYREPSQVARDTAALYREASQVARDTPPLCREPSQVAPDTAPLYREASHVARDAAASNCGTGWSPPWPTRSNPSVPVLERDAPPVGHVIRTIPNPTNSGKTDSRARVAWNPRASWRARLTWSPCEGHFIGLSGRRLEPHARGWPVGKPDTHPSDRRSPIWHDRCILHSRRQGMTRSTNGGHRIHPNPCGAEGGPSA